MSEMSKEKEEKTMSKHQTALDEMNTRGEFYIAELSEDKDEEYKNQAYEKSLMQELVDRAQPTITDREFDLMIDSINLAQSHVRLYLKRGIHSFAYSVYMYKSFGSVTRHFYDINTALEYVVGIRDVLDSLAQNKGGL